MGAKPGVSAEFSMNPSNFTDQPWSSIFLKSEHETIARNCMVIQKRMGDEWRVLTWEEYFEARSKDGASERNINGEKKYFDDVVEHTSSPEKAMSFSPTWKSIYLSLKEPMAANP